MLMRTFNRVLDHLEEWLVASFMALATGVIFVSVLYRYTADIAWIWSYTRHINLTWAQELCIYLLPKRRFWIIFDLLAGAFFTGVIAVLGGLFVFRMFGTGQVSPDLELPMWIVYLAVPLGSSLMCYRFLQVAWRFRRTGELPAHSHAHVEGLGAEART